MYGGIPELYPSLQGVADQHMQVQGNQYQFASNQQGPPSSSSLTNSVALGGPLPPSPPTGDLPGLLEAQGLKAEGLLPFERAFQQNGGWFESLDR